MLLLNIDITIIEKERGHSGLICTYRPCHVWRVPGHYDVVVVVSQGIFHDELGKDVFKVEEEETRLLLAAATQGVIIMV